QGMEPFVTLWHWGIPVWLAEKGGAAEPHFARYYGRYAERVAQVLGPEVRFWITLNEPEVFSSNGYLTGIWPPGERNVLRYRQVIGNLVAAHRDAYLLIKESDPDAQVGIAAPNAYLEAAQGRPINQLLRSGVAWWWN